MLDHGQEGMSSEGTLQWLIDMLFYFIHFILQYVCYLKNWEVGPGMMVHAFRSITWETEIEAGGFLYI